MATKAGAAITTDARWSVLTRQAWDGSEELETVLVEALHSLDGIDEDETLFEYVDTEALNDVLARTPSETGASEIRFDFQDYEVRLTHRGIIAVR